MATSVVCVAVVGKENEPAYLRTFTSDPTHELKFQYYVHASLDVIEEKVNPAKKASGSAPTDLYLGQLFSMEQFKVYGYITNTKIKFVVITQDSSNDINMKSWLRYLHGLYVTTLSNPFYDLSSSLAQCAPFHEHVSQFVRLFADRRGIAA